MASDPERKSRFEREAKTVAALSHPHICPVFDVGSEDGTDFLVMEYLEGETLAERIAKGALPLDQALRYAIQIADALDKAHRQGVTHRDLKPANIMLTKAGAKLLDFGLAKLKQPDVKADLATLAATRTQEQPLTEKGTVLGTVQYMAPEQLEGRDADHRSDIFAFGAIMYEMVTGQRAFQGKSQLSLMTAILEHDPPLISASTEMSPPTLDHLVKTCLAKDPDARWQAVGDVARQLSWVGESSLHAGEAPIAPPALWQRPVPAVALGLGIALVTGLTVWTLTRPALAPPASITRMSIVLPETQQRTNLGRRGIAISPTGTHLVYVADGLLYLHRMEELEAEPIASTAESFPTVPFFSPDGRWIGFFSTRDGELQKVAIDGGPTVTICETNNPFGASWGPDDTIVFGLGGQGVFRVPAGGGSPESLVNVDADRDEYAQGPQLLAGGAAVLYTRSIGRSEASLADAQIVVEVMETGERRVLVEGGTDARYLPTGHLVYAKQGILFAVAFDIERLAVTGASIPLVQGVRHAAFTGGVNFDISNTGTLAYLPGPAAMGFVNRRLLWVDRDTQQEEPIAAEARSYVSARISPDGHHAALQIGDQDQDIWIWDFRNETLRRLTFDLSRDSDPVWTPDGRRVVFASARDGRRNIYSKAADGTGTVERLTQAQSDHTPLAVSADGKHLLFKEEQGDTGSPLLMLSLDAPDDVRTLLSSVVTSVVLSPNDSWLAYTRLSTRGSEPEVLVGPFPNVSDGMWQISTAGGSSPLWSPDGSELFYEGFDRRIRGVQVEVGDGFSPSTPEVVVDAPYYSNALTRPFDISPDGRRFLVIQEGPDVARQSIHVVLNWDQELLERVPVP